MRRDPYTAARALEARARLVAEQCAAGLLPGSALVVELEALAQDANALRRLLVERINPNGGPSNE